MQSHRYWSVHWSDRWWIKLIVVAVSFFGLFTTGKLKMPLSRRLTGRIPVALCPCHRGYILVPGRLVSRRTAADTQFVAGFGTYSPFGGDPTWL